MLFILPDYIVISPGPGTPAEAGISIDVIQYFTGKIPIFGVCLGMQSMGEAFGGKIVRARALMHGKLPPQAHHKNLSFLYFLKQHWAEGGAP